MTAKENLQKLQPFFDEDISYEQSQLGKIPPGLDVLCLSIFRSSPERWPNKPCKNVRPFVCTSVCTSTIKHDAATKQIVVFVKVNETFTMIWLSRSSEVRVKVRRWPQSPIGTIFEVSTQLTEVKQTVTITCYEASHWLASLAYLHAE